MSGRRERGGKLLCDIFVAGGTQHFASLAALLPKLSPFGVVHLASITLDEPQIAALAPYVDVLHRPRHDDNGYRNFNLFCIRDINRSTTRRCFVKLDADTVLSDDWFEYVRAGLATAGDAVLFGIEGGRSRIDAEISGSFAAERLGRSIRVAGGTKVIGGFYVGDSRFFRRHDALMQGLHEAFYCFAGGTRVRPWPRTFWPDILAGDRMRIALGDGCRNLPTLGDEDTLRSLVVHAAGARLAVLPGGDRVQIGRPEPISALRLAAVR